MDESIEAAEEAGDKGKLLDVLKICAEKADDDDEWQEPTEAALDAYYRLSKGGRANAADAATDDDDGVLETILSCLKAYRAEESIVEVGLGCLVAFASSSSSAARSVVDPNLSILVAAMRDFPDEATLQEQACLAVEALASASNVWKAKLAATAGVREELSAARARITNERHKSYPARAAAALGIAL